MTSRRAGPAALCGVSSVASPPAGATRRTAAADDAGAAPERDDRDSLPGADLEDPSHLLGAARQDHRIRRGLQPPDPQPDQIGVAAADGAAKAMLVREQDAGSVDGVDDRLR